MKAPMRSLRQFALLFFLACSLTSCLYGKVILPLDKDVADTTLGAKVGRASVQSVAWLVAWGDAGVEAAAKNGGLTTVRHLDTERFVLIFGLYTRITTIAYGD
jgi:hypothetical protein